MKLQLDTTSKTIKIEDDVKISNLISTLKKMFPNNEWKDYKLKTNTVIEHWSNPIVVKEKVYPWHWERPWIVWGSTTGNYSTGSTAANYNSLSAQSSEYKVNSGIFNVELKG